MVGQLCSHEHGVEGGGRHGSRTLSASSQGFWKLALVDAGWPLNAVRAVHSSQLH